jgi:hypothetical protein
MCRFSRLRASASTWSFQRAVFHSGAPRLTVEPERAVLMLGCERSESRRRLMFTSSDVMALDLEPVLDLDVDMAHLRAVERSCGPLRPDHAGLSLGSRN